MEDQVERILSRRRRQNLGRLQPVGLVAAAVLHLALVVVAVVVPSLSAEEQEPLQIVNVRIVPTQALGTPQPPRSEPEPQRPPPPEPEPEPEPTVDEPATEEVPPDPEPAPQRDPERPVLPDPDATPKPRQEPPEPTPQPAAAEPPAPRQGAPTGSPAGITATGTNLSAIGDPDFTYGYYLDRVLSAIEANWRRPPTDGVALQVVVNFRIRRDGTVSELEVVEDSGLSSFDLAGLRAVQASSPLPPLPAGFRKDSLAIRLIVR